MRISGRGLDRCAVVGRRKNSSRDAEAQDIVSIFVGQPSTYNTNSLVEAVYTQLYYNTNSLAEAVYTQLYYISHPGRETETHFRLDIHAYYVYNQSSYQDPLDRARC